MYHTCTDPLCQRLIVRDGNQDHIVLFNFLQNNGPDLRLCDRIETCRDLVGNEHARLRTERPQDREALQLPSGQLMRPARQPSRFRTDRCKQFLRYIPGLTQGITDLFQRGSIAFSGC